MYARSIGDRILTFDFAEGLLNDNLLIVDRETSSLWSQLDGKAISGPLEGTPLRILPALQTTWGHWRRLHPETRVMVVEAKHGKPYFYRNSKPGAPLRRSTRHDTSALGLGLALGQASMYFPLSELKRSPQPIRVTLGDRPIVVHHVDDAMTAWADDEKGQLLPGVLAYRSGWLNFHPHSAIYHAPAGD